MEINKKLPIRELLIPDENDETTGVQAVAFVDNPAIDVNFYHFADIENVNDVEMILQNAILRLSDILGEDASEEFLKEMDPNYKFGFWDTIRGLLGGNNDDDAREIMKQIIANPKYESEDIQLANGWTYKVRFKYVGDIIETSRDFCRSMVKKNKLFRLADIEALNEVVGPYIPRPKGSPVNVFEFKGGANCRHSWVQIRYLESDRGKVRILEKLTNWNGENEPTLEGSPVNPPVDPENISKGLKKAGFKSFSFVNNEQRICAGPVMIPNKLIVRKDTETGDLYNVFFSKETVKKLSEKYMRDHKLNSANLMHESDKPIPVTMLESWIVEDTTHDKSNLYGHELPVGSWFATFRVNDEEAWKRVKSGEIKGFSIEGMFSEKEVKLA